MDQTSLDQFLLGRKPNTVRAYRQALDSWATAGAPETPEGLRAWFYSLTDLSASTRNLYLSAVQSYLKFSGIDVAHKIRRPNTQDLVSPTRAMSSAEVRLFLQDPDPRWRCAWHLLFFLGLRRSELVRLKVFDVERQADGGLVLRILHPKDGKYRALLVPEPAATELRSYLKTAPTVLFDVTASHLACIFRRRAQLLGMGNLGPHCARATFVTRCLESGWAYREIMRITGHSNQDMVARYDKRRVVNKGVSYED